MRGILNILGLMELYEATGDKKLLTTMDNLFHVFIDQKKIMIDRSLHLSSFELCDEQVFMIFCQQMFKLTGQPKYADAAEYILYNDLSGKDHATDHYFCTVLPPYEGQKDFMPNPDYPDYRTICCYSLQEVSISYLYDLPSDIQ